MIHLLAREAQPPIDAFALDEDGAEHLGAIDALAQPLEPSRLRSSKQLRHRDKGAGEDEDEGSSSSSPSAR